MELTPMVANYMILFSKTAISQLKLYEKVKLRNSLNNACINFRHYSATTATKTLVTLYYGDSSKREEVISKLFQNMHCYYLEDTAKTNSQKILQFNEEEYQALANELLYQYSAANPGVLSIETDCDEYKKELNNLKVAMSQHPVLLFRTVQMCKVVSHVEPIASRCVALLLSKNAVCQRIGLESIGFNFEYRVLLFPYAKEIGLLLQAMNKTTKNLISPFATWLNQHDEVECISDELPQYLLLSEFEKFLNEDSRLISELPNSTDLKACLTPFKGNLNVLLENDKYLQLTKAIVNLLFAKRFYRETQEDFSMGNMESVITLSKSLKIWESAKSSYNAILNVFIHSCK